MTLAVLIAAGGTGGHMMPAHALSEALRRRGHAVALLSDPRGVRFPGLFEGVERHLLDSATASGLDPLGWLRAARAVAAGRSAGRRVARAMGADAVIGFGGYPSLPGVLAGLSLGLPAILHEQNAVLGRVNRRLQGRVSRLALSYPQTARVSPAARVVVTGNPVRPEIAALGNRPFRAPADGEPWRILVIGGSQGARILSERVPQALAKLPREERARLSVVQQCREEDQAAVEASYAKAGIAHDCHPFLADLPRRLGEAHLVISRAGASTMAELVAAGRPAILVPFAAATDDHQAANARRFVGAGAGQMLREDEASPARIGGMVRGFFEGPEALEGAAAAARALGVPDAADRLADLVEEVAGRAAGRAAA